MTVTPIRRLFNRMRLQITPQVILAIVFLAVLGYLVVVPRVVLVQETFIGHPLDRFQIPGSMPGDFTTPHWEPTVVGRDSFAFFYRPLINTLIVACSMALLALGIGGGLAWLVVRSNLPLKGFVSNAAIIPYTMPSWTLALAWITIFK